MFKLNYDPTVDSGFAVEPAEAQLFSFKYSCRVHVSEMEEEEGVEKLKFSRNAQVGRSDMLTHV